MGTGESLSDLTSALDNAAASLGTSFAKGLTEVVRSGTMSRDAVSDLMVEVGLTTPESQLRAAVDVTVECIRHAIADHALTPEELDAVRTLKRACGIEEGDILRLRGHDVADLLREAMEVVLHDQVVTGREAAYKVGLQEAFGLSYDEFYELTIEQLNSSLRALRDRVVPQGRPATYRQLKELQLRAAHLDSVFTIDLGVTRSRAGHVYALINRSMPGLVKVGMTQRSPEERAAELSSSTGIPSPFVVAFDIAVSDVLEAERGVHDRLTELGFRLVNDREFFKAPLKTVIEVMTEIESDLEGPRWADDSQEAGVHHGGPDPAAEHIAGRWDELLLAAAEACLQNGGGSPSFLARRLHIGYERASRITDQLFHAGLLGPPDETEERAVLVSRDELDAIFGL